jgi:NTE family protein
MDFKINNKPFISSIMEISDFTQNKDVLKVIERMKKDKVDEKQFSDILDTTGKQYVELVQEGGGVLGVALLGYTHVLEQMGLRFFSLAGTSAGSINAMLLAGLGDVSKPKSEKVIEAMVNKDLYDFVDGNDDSRDFIKALVEKAKRTKLIWKGLQIIDEINDDLGLNPGNDFLIWLTTFLKKYNILNLSDLNEHFGKIPDNLIIREGIDKTLKGLQPRLSIIAADLTTETKVEFPRMASLYWANPEKENPAYYVRASMSIPYFFSPLVISNIPQGPVAVKNWGEMVSFTGKIPRESVFVDGGILSNFPIDVFHKKNSVPRLPTFGVRLGDNRNQANRVSNPANLFGAMFNSIRHLHDYDFILKNSDYKMLIGKIDIGNHDWLNFGIKNEAKLDLFIRGAQAADKFLRSFDWIAYKKIREQTFIPE